MPTDKRRIMLTIDDELFAALGLDPVEDGAAAVTGALARHAAHLTAAAREIGRLFDRDEWGYLVDSNNSVLWDGHPNAALRIAANVEDAHQIDELGAKWFGDADYAPRAVGSLLAKLAKLTPIQAEAVAVAIRWFWMNCESIDMAEAPWWTVGYRAQRGRSK